MIMMGDHKFIFHLTKYQYKENDKKVWQYIWWWWDGISLWRDSGSSDISGGSSHVIIHPQPGRAPSLLAYNSFRLFYLFFAYNSFRLFYLFFAYNSLRLFYLFFAYIIILSDYFIYLCPFPPDLHLSLDLEFWILIFNWILIQKKRRRSASSPFVGSSSFVESVSSSFVCI